MKKKLVIVESPSKSKTIEKYLGSSYHVTSSKGHIRDLATTGKGGLGVDIENDFKPNYIAVDGKKKLISDLKKEVASHEKIYLATDPDREGEAISWHIANILNVGEDEVCRITFNEITKNAVKESLKKCNLEFIGAYDDFDFNPGDDSSDRIYIVAKCRKG